MASTTTGEMFTQEQYEAMSAEDRVYHGLVRINQQEQDILQPMTQEQRKEWLKIHKSKKPSRRQINKRERQNKRKARAR